MTIHLQEPRRTKSAPAHATAKSPRSPRGTKSAPAHSTAESSRGPRGARRTPARSTAESPRLAIVGAGRVGGALAVLLSRRGWKVTAIASRALADARRLARRCGATIATTDPARASRAADVVLIAVPDRMIADIVRAMAANEQAPGPIARRSGPPLRAHQAIQVALHTSGATGAGSLSRLRDSGYAVGSFHPLLSFPPGAHPLPPFDGTTIAIDGDPAARRVGRALALSLGARALILPEQERARYHLAACFGSNYLVTLAAEAASLLADAGMSRTRALEALLPLLRSTVANLGASGLPHALTGPVARGDDVTVRRHALLLLKTPKEIRDLHRLLVRRTARLARAAGWLDATAARRLERALALR